ncbi:carboxypeptidase Y-deficient [Malassezia sp. CBS 17886]|nr:carboxypeptidase Y-deficient [Malassezia sp. CBS 17886]
MSQPAPDRPPAGLAYAPYQKRTGAARRAPSAASDVQQRASSSAEGGAPPPLRHAFDMDAHRASPMRTDSPPMAPPPRSSSRSPSRPRNGSPRVVRPPVHHSYASVLAQEHEETAVLAESPAPPPPAPLVLGDSAAYRAGFQPRGVVRHRTDEFMRRRTQRQRLVELEEQRMERRLAKLVAIYCAGVPGPSKAHGLLASFGAQDGAAHALRVAEQSVVKWQEGSHCVLCGTKFSLILRRHHCRLERLVIDRRRGIFTSMPSPPSSHAPAAAWQALYEAETNAVRFCGTCAATVRRLALRHGPGDVPLLARYYEALQALQKDIDEALPAFHELMLTLRKRQTDGARGGIGEQVTTDALKARAALQGRFAQYERLARQIRALSAGENATQARLQGAIYQRAMQYLQHFGRNAELRVLQEQDELLAGYLAAASRARQLDDVATLKENQNEVRAAIARLQAAAAEETHLIEGAASAAQ